MKGAAGGPERSSFSAGEVIFACRPFVAVLDRKFKFQVSPNQF